MQVQIPTMEAHVQLLVWKDFDLKLQFMKLYIDKTSDWGACTLPSFWIHIFTKQGTQHDGNHVGFSSWP